MQVPLFSVILFSWTLAFIEYCLAVPANRYGSAVYSAAQLKTMQEVITFLVFAVFSFVYLKEPITWSQGFGFTLIAAGAFSCSTSGKRFAPISMLSFRDGALAPGPESITPVCDYGFRARSLRSRPGMTKKNYFAGVTRRMWPAPLSVSR
jgi:uncharacterized protein (DUF486 family)